MNPNHKRRCRHLTLATTTNEVRGPAGTLEQVTVHVACIQCRQPIPATTTTEGPLA